jgi:hypothetical protein
MDYAWVTISNDISWDTHLSSLLKCTGGMFCDTQQSTKRGGASCSHWVHSSINAGYGGMLLWMVLAMRYIHGSYVWRRMCVIGGTNKAMMTWSTIWPLTLLKMSSIIIISSRQTSNKYLNFGFYTYLYSYLNSWDGRRGACCKATKCTHQQLHDHASLVAAYSSASAKFLH